MGARNTLAEVLKGKAAPEHVMQVVDDVMKNLRDSVDRTLARRWSMLVQVVVVMMAWACTSPKTNSHSGY